MKRRIALALLIATLALALLLTEPAEGPGYVCDPAYSETCP
ncbi:MULTISPECIES: hypothetical protein [unclassified Aeromicrobium]|nr:MULTISPECIES: hypothetical protein [unclassified Aeromicrobium]